MKLFDKAEYDVKIFGKSRIVQCPTEVQYFFINIFIQNRLSSKHDGLL